MLCISLEYPPNIEICQLADFSVQELVNRYARRSVRLAYPSYIESHFKMCLTCMDFNLLVLTRLWILKSPPAVS